MACRGFEQLKVWRRAMDVVAAAYRFTASLPAEEKSGLSAAMRRSASGLPITIADAWGRPDREALAKAVEDAFATLREMQTQMRIAQRLRYVHWLGSRRLTRAIARLETELHMLADRLETQQVADRASEAARRVRPRPAKSLPTRKAA